MCGGEEVPAFREASRAGSGWVVWGVFGMVSDDPSGFDVVSIDSVVYSPVGGSFSIEAISVSADSCEVNVVFADLLSFPVGEEGMYVYRWWLVHVLWFAVSEAFGVLHYPAPVHEFGSVLVDFPTVGCSARAVESGVFLKAELLAPWAWCLPVAG